MDFLRPSNPVHLKGPAKVLGLYLLFSASWIICTDVVLGHAFGPAVGAWQTAKGLLYLVVSGAILFWLCRRLVTEANRMERTLSEIFQQTAFGVFVADEKGTVLDCNKAFASLVGYSREALIGTNLRILVHPEQHEMATREWSVIFQNPNLTSYVRQRKYLQRSGNDIWVRVAVSRIVNPHESLQFAVGLVQNVTAEVQSFNALEQQQKDLQVMLTAVQESEARAKRTEAKLSRLELAVENAYESIIITDLDSKIVYVNPAFEELTGYTRAEILGKKPSILKSVRTAEEEHLHLWKTITSGHVWKGRLWNRRKNATEYLEDVTISPIRDSNGDVINYLAVKRDITREHALEHRLMQSEKLEAVGQLAGGVAHDLNNVLQVVHSSAELASRHTSDANYIGRKLTNILTASKRGAGIISQLLMFARRQTVSPQVLELNQVISETASMLRRLLPENVELALDLVPDLFSIQADPVRISQVVLNLAVNARDAMPNGGLLSIETLNSRATNGPQNRVVLLVSDTGVGIDPEIQSKIFQPFFTTKAEGKGTGLGLATVMEIVQQCGGTIEVSSSPGCGTLFRVEFPAVETVVPDANSCASLSKESFALNGYVLVCEDDESVRTAMCDYMDASGLTVVRCSNADQAIAEAQKMRPAMLVTDVIMPGKSGLQLAHELRAMHTGLPVLLVSGHTEHEILNEIAADKDAVLLQKPFSGSVLLAHMRDLNSNTLE